MRVVSKPWGREEIWAETPKYVGKYLYINRGHRLSRQYHEKKEETIRVMQGVLLLELGFDFDSGFDSNVVQLSLSPGDVYHITPKTVHRFCAKDEDVVLVEVSTPELDDVVRISDDYSR
jgi:mannose-6-phosphate isomerase-like protein (cupin superfamily)